MLPDSHLDNRVSRRSITIGAVIGTDAAARKEELARRCAVERIAQGMASQEDVFRYGNADQSRMLQARGLKVLNETMQARAAREEINQF